jgi:lipoate-protein ligase A
VGAVPAPRFVNSAPSALFDPEPLRLLARPTLVRLRLDEPVVVLGSTQRPSDLDGAALERGGIGMRRRRGGGGAVLLHPEDLWLELWLPRRDEDPLDVRASAHQLGAWWRAALRSAGVECEVHEGAVDHPQQGAIACFAAVGPGEVTVGRAKLVGISQWRVREGTLASSVLAVRPPLELSSYLTRDAPRLAASTWLGATASSSSADDLAIAFTREVKASRSDLEVGSTHF